MEKKANEKRGLILFLSFVSMLAALAVDNDIASILLAGGCILVSVIILYRNLALLTSVTTEDMKLRVLRVTTIFNIVVLSSGNHSGGAYRSGCALVFGTGGKDCFNAGSRMYYDFYGNCIAEACLLQRHTGLRLPWTIRDEATWNLAHRILGYISPAPWPCCMWRVP